MLPAYRNSALNAVRYRPTTDEGAAVMDLCRRFAGAIYEAKRGTTLTAVNDAGFARAVLTALVRTLALEGPALDVAGQGECSLTEAHDVVAEAIFQGAPDPERPAEVAITMTVKFIKLARGLLEVLGAGGSEEMVQALREVIAERDSLAAQVPVLEAKLDSIGGTVETMDERARLSQTLEARRRIGQRNRLHEDAHDQAPHAISIRQDGRLSRCPLNPAMAEGVVNLTLASGAKVAGVFRAKVEDVPAEDVADPAEAEPEPVHDPQRDRARLAERLEKAGFGDLAKRVERPAE